MLRAAVCTADRRPPGIGWELPWYSTADAFNADCDVTTGFGLSVFIRDDDGARRSY